MNLYMIVTEGKHYRFVYAVSAESEQDAQDKMCKPNFLCENEEIVSVEVIRETIEPELIVSFEFARLEL
jgi:hypothetical protein